MFYILDIRIINKTLVTGILAINSIGANAALTSYGSNGVDLVYSSVSDVTWTKDANLLGSLPASQGFNNVVNAIIAASPTISNTPNEYSPTGSYTLSAHDFSSNGGTSWFGALAYVNYLNSINYAGSNQWRLPTAVSTTQGNNTTTNGKAKGDELVELYYHELGSKGYYDTNGNTQSDYGIKDPQNKFVNEQSYLYWSGTEYAPVPLYALSFGTTDGYQYTSEKGNQRLYAWAVSPGQVSTVPESESAAMLLAGLGLVSLFSCSRKAKK